ncbi:MAG: hypothetical protein BJ554DRAFT_1015 [Olpidium bornovanus]|uniref:Uncharacterized protein n=1 Tax=Olpidium bornovanus TaxID=278681 RepID=A0A8H8DLR7_9FUNG|nr:MAG: hypothetical protein BJ554DRAFT_1015 [Olpidium bornovanus]
MEKGLIFFFPVILEPEMKTESTHKASTGHGVRRFGNGPAALAFGFGRRPSPSFYFAFTVFYCKAFQIFLQHSSHDGRPQSKEYINTHHDHPDPRCAASSKPCGRENLHDSQSGAAEVPQMKRKRVQPLLPPTAGIERNPAGKKKEKKGKKITEHPWAARRGSLLVCEHHVRHGGQLNRSALRFGSPFGSPGLFKTRSVSKTTVYK